MNNLFKLLIILSVVTATGCKRQYTIEGDRVYYESWNEGSGNSKWLLDSADAKTFTPLKFDCNCSFLFAKDKRHLFIDGTPIKKIDPNSFTFVGHYIFRDKDSAYFFGFYNDINNCVISGVDPNKIKLLRYPWARADNILLHGGEKIMLDDIDDFVPIDEDWGKTRSKILNENKILPGADPATFTIINSFSGKDEHHTYELGKIKN